MHAALRARHSLAIHLSSSAGSGFEALEQAKREMETSTERQGSEDMGGRRRGGEVFGLFVGLVGGGCDGCY